MLSHVELKKGIYFVFVPGTTAFLASAEALGIQLKLKGFIQTIILTRLESITKFLKREKFQNLQNIKQL